MMIPPGCDCRKGLRSLFQNIKGYKLPEEEVEE
jgi:hypothetical protein